MHLLRRFLPLFAILAVLLLVGMQTDAPHAATTDPAAPSLQDVPSCVGDNACYGATATIGAGSCIGEDACRGASGTIGVGSCIGEYACMNSSGSVGDDSCNGPDACHNAGLGGSVTVGNSSCEGVFACYGSGLWGTSSIGDNSCNGTETCTAAGFQGASSIGNNSCNGDGSCMNSGDDGTSTIGAYSCNGSGQCSGVGSGSTSTIGDCAENTVAVACPSTTTAALSSSTITSIQTVDDVATVTGNKSDGSAGLIDPTGSVQFYYCYDASTAPTSCDASSGTAIALAITLTGGADTADGIATATLDDWKPGTAGYYLLHAVYAGDSNYPGSFDDGTGQSLTVTTAPKCQGTNACAGATVANIADGSCNGSFACFQVAGTIAEGSCIGVQACVGVTATVAEQSCIADFACNIASVSIGQGSCNAGYSCYAMDGPVGDGSCLAWYACYDSSSTVGDESCNDLYACRHATADSIGDGSCNSDYACYYVSGTLGNGSCNAYGACYEASLTVADDSCNGTNACIQSGTGGSSAIGSNSCNGTGACGLAGSNNASLPAGTSPGESSIGDAACNGASACYSTGVNGFASTGDESCNGEQACYNAGLLGTSTVGRISCNGKDACRNVGNTDAGNAASAIGDCEENIDPVTCAVATAALSSSSISTGQAADNVATVTGNKPTPETCVAVGPCAAAPPPGGLIDPTGTVQFYYCYDASTAPADCDSTTGAAIGSPIAIVPDASPYDGIATATLDDWTPPDGAGYYLLHAVYSGDTNYPGLSRTSVNQPLTVTSSLPVLTITADDLDVEYGEAEPTYTFTASGWVGADSESSLPSGWVEPTCALSGTETYSPTDPAGTTYTIVCSGGAADGYTFEYAPGTLTVNQATLVLDVDDLDVEYGDAEPEYTYGLTGFKNGEDEEDLETTVSCTLTDGPHDPAADAGTTYTISCTFAGTDTNYTLDDTDTGTLTVTRATLTLTVDDLDVEYGDAEPEYTYDLTGFKNGEDEEDLQTFIVCDLSDGPHDSLANAGTTYTIACTFDGNDTNYILDDMDTGTLTVIKATLTVTPDDQAIDYGDPAPEYTFDVTGFKNSETADTLDPSAYTAPTCSAPSILVTSTISCSGGVATNYDFNYETATLTVTPLELEPTQAWYTGQLLYWTKSATDTAARVTLTASITANITCGEGASVADAFVTFKDSLTGKVFAKDVPVTEVNGQCNEGIATAFATLSSGTDYVSSYVIAIDITGAITGTNYGEEEGHQLSADPGSATVTVSAPVPNTTGFFGSGSLVFKANASTTDLGTEGTITSGMQDGDSVDFSFGFTFGKKGVTPRGQVNLIIPGPDGSFYYIKSNAITSLTTSNGNLATLYAKASIVQVNADLSVVAIDGGVSLRMDVTDTGDLAGFTIQSAKSSVLYFSNHWVKTGKAWATAQQAVQPSTPAGYITVN